MTLVELKLKIDEDLALQLKQFCQENRLHYGEAVSEILYGFFEDSTLTNEFLDSEEYADPLTGLAKDVKL